MQNKPSAAFISYVPGPLALRVISKIHTAIYRGSSGQVGHRLDGLNILLLTTQGRKSGKCYRTPMPYFEHSAGYLLIASNAGSASNPGWYHNLLHQPQVKIQVGAKTFEVVASPLIEPERQDWWDKLIALQPRYAGYQRTTQRCIPIVLLEHKILDS